jgi:signal transduction histidine kinase
MGGASIARRLRLVLVGVTVTLLAVMALGVAGLYGARTDYEDTLSESYALEAAADDLEAAGTAEQAAAAAAAGRARTPLARARVAFARAAGRARALAEADPPSLELVSERQALQGRLRDARSRQGPAGRRLQRRLVAEARRVTGALGERQVERRDAARDEAGDETRAAAITIAGAGFLILLAAFLLVRDFARGVRRPLDELVAATSRVAAGQLGERVPAGGPRELRELTSAFNVMTADLRDARERIEYERRKLAVTIESLGDGLVVCDAAGTVTTFNPRAARLVPGLRVGRRLDGDDGPLPAVEEATGGEAAVALGGRSLAVTAARLEGGDGGTVWTIRDITERVRLEQMKSDFVAAASHELRSPLTSIKGFVELLDRSEGLSAKQREAVEIIRASTGRLVELVEDLLEVTRIEAGQVAIDVRALDVGDVVREATTLLAPRIESRRQELAIELPRDLPPALADARRLQQIVENLLTNAHLYTPAEGRIALRAEASRSEVSITVSDTGRGMTEEEVEHAFDRFYRGREPDTLVPGTGLGLWIVRSLAELQGGSVEAASELGQGSTFTVRLPRAPSGAAADRQPRSPRRTPAFAQRGRR